MTLGERALEWSLEEAEREPIPAPVTKSLWFAGCVRGGKKMWPSGITPAQAAKLNHCAAAVCYATARAMFEMFKEGIGSSEPHGYRASAKELMRDALEKGTWHGVHEARSGLWLPRPGDLAIYDRSVPNRPETAWWGHVDRVIDADADGYANIGANEGIGGAWKREHSLYTNPRLLGFVSYATPDPVLDPQLAAHVSGAVAISMDEAEANWWEEEFKRV